MGEANAGNARGLRARFAVSALALAALFAAPTMASEQFGDTNVSFLSLKVNARGMAHG